VKLLTWLTIIVGLFSVEVIYACENKVKSSKNNLQLLKKDAKKPLVSKSIAGKSKPLRDAEKAKPADKNQPIYIIPNQFPYKTIKEQKENKKGCS